MHTAFPSFPRFFGRQKRKKSRLKFAFWQLFFEDFQIKKGGRKPPFRKPLDRVFYDRNVHRKLRSTFLIFC